MTCPQCGFALIAYMGHDTCSMGCGFDGPTRAPTAEERGKYRTREPQFTKTDRATERPRASEAAATPRSAALSVPGSVSLRSWAHARTGGNRWG